MNAIKLLLIWSVLQNLSMAQQFATIAPAGDAMLFDDSLDGMNYFVDEHTFLAWEKIPSQEHFVDLQAAHDYCHALSWGGLAWKLASSIELRSLFTTQRDLNRTLYLSSDIPSWDTTMLLGFDAKTMRIVPLLDANTSFIGRCAASIE